jgi:hypothetical protein
MHFLSLFHHFFFMICDWGSPSFLCRGVRRQRNLRLWLGYFFYSRDPRFMSLIDSLWFVKFSKMANFNFHESWFLFFFIFWDSWPETLPPPPFKVFVYGKGVQNRSKFTNSFFFNFHLYFLGGIRLSCLPLNCHYHQISFTLKQVVPVSY